MNPTLALLPKLVDKKPTSSWWKLLPPLANVGYGAQSFALKQTVFLSQRPQVAITSKMLAIGVPGFSTLFLLLIGLNNSSACRLVETTAASGGC
ncbi:hypothetical protein ABWH96_12560 [Marivirga tractuosa]|uniref:hypothetical protein n=1 Tax=Marivirga tractuosa TaxID=1006 RepID=UPI0035CF0D5C